MKARYICPRCNQPLESMTELAKRHGISLNKLKSRVYRKGISIEKAIALGAERLDKARR